VDSDFPSIGSDNWGGGMAATRHLIELGHKRIGTIAGPLRFLCSQARLAGYRAALERASVPADDRLVAPGDFHYRAGYESALALLDRADPPTAIFAANDEQALAVYAVAHQLGLRIPQDLSVVGFDDVPMSQWITPPLTTVRQPITDLAALATRALLDGGDLRGGGLGGGLPGRVELATTLVVRGSTGPCRAG
jgi:DNA-binding LacI/PurR family transcriptional regulator